LHYAKALIGSRADKKGLFVAEDEIFFCSRVFARRGTFNYINMLVMKRIAGRPKDRIDIEALEKIKRGEDPYV
jgi:hypothetical protein